MSRLDQSSSCATPLTRRTALARLGLAAGCLAVPTVLSAPPKPAVEVKGGQRMLQMLEEDRQARALPHERNCPMLAELHRKYEQLPSRIDYVCTVRSGNTIRLAVEKRGLKKSNRIIVLVHGLLADRETWIYVAGALGQDHELWLIDLPGCGLSEAPNPKHVEEDAYSPAGMADRILQVIGYCLEERQAQGLPKPELVIAGHSLGGTVCLRMVGDPGVRRRHHHTLQRVAALALFAPCDVAINAEIPCFMTVLDLTAVKVRVGMVLGIANDKVREITREAYHARPCATQEQAQHFTEALTKIPKLRAAQAMIRAAVPWKEQEHRPDWPRIKQVEAGYANVDLPCLIAWGEWDETLTECMGHKIRDKVPTARLVEVEGAGHCLPSEVPLFCAQVIRKTEELVRNHAFHSLAPVSRFGKGFSPGLPLPQLQSPALISPVPY